MDYSRLVKREKNTENYIEYDENAWKWINLRDKEAIQLFAECQRLDKEEEELKELEKKCAIVQKWRYDEWVRDREYRKSMGEHFYECSENDK